jgi:Monooxygenase af470-like
MTVDRRTVDLTQYPDLVVIYLGMRVNAFFGLKTLLGLGPQIKGSVAAKPDGLLLHEDLIFSLVPVHAGMRQYWRDWESLERWAHSEPHRLWWQKFLKDSGGTGFWHETYFMRGGMEAIYDDMDKPIGMLSFAPFERARGRMFSARSRLGLGEPRLSAVIPEDALTD